MAAIVQIPVDLLIQRQEECKLQQGNQQELLYPPLTALLYVQRYLLTEVATSGMAKQTRLLSCCWVGHQCHLVSPLLLTPRNLLLTTYV